MSKQNRIIVPSHFSVFVEIKLDPNNGQTELQVRNVSGKNISMLQIAGLLSEHVASVMRGLITGTTEMKPVEAPAESPKVQ